MKKPAVLGADVRRLLGNRPVLAGMIFIAFAALYGAAAFSRPVAGATPVAQRRAPVLSGAVACPDPGGGDKVKTRVAALTPQGTPQGAPQGPRGKGRAQVAELKPDAPAAAVTSLANPGAAWYAEAKDGKAPYSVRADGAMAGGLTVEQTSGSGSGSSRGLAGLRCATPGIDMWFVGPGPVQAEDIELHLVNVDDQPAAVDIEALSQDGPIDTTESRGIAVKPYGSQVVPIGDKPEGLADVADNAQVLAMRVQSRQGRVAAAVRVKMKDGGGIDWVPVAEPPAGRLVVPGVPKGEGARELLVAVPGDADARVRVEVVTEKGVFVPEGRDVLDAPAQTVTRLGLDRVLNGRASAVRIASDQPVVASLVARTGGDADDVAMTASVSPLVERGAVADVGTGPDADAKLLLSASEGNGAVRVATVTSAGTAGAAQDVRIPAGRTTSVTLRAPQGAEQGYGIVITPQPGSGPVHAARVLTVKKQGFTVLPVTSARTWIAAPAVDDSVTAIIP